jgi:hypothetical protein
LIFIISLIQIVSRLEFGSQANGEETSRLKGEK